MDEQVEEARDPDYARSEDFYFAVAAVLLAGDVQARVVANPETFWIEVSLIDGSKVLWTNAREYWGYSLIDPQGEMTVAEFETLPWDVDVVDAAKMIAMHDYPVTVEFPER